MLNELTRRNLLTGVVPALGVAGALAAWGPLVGQVSAQAVPAAGGGPVADAMAAAFKDGEYALPPLPYDYAALEPNIDADTMHLHHDKHHQAYVTGLNKAIKAIAELNATAGPGNPSLLTGLQEDLSFNAGGHLLHTVFWATMAPPSGGGGGEPSGALTDAITKDFGSVETFRTQFSRVAAGVKGSGWAVLAYLPLGQKLMILQVKQHDLQLAAGAVPLLPLDVWEHAYYLKYKNLRADYVKAWWNVLNWSAVDQALAKASA